MDPGFNRISIDFLFTELSSGFTFAGVALSALPGDRERIERNTHNARKAYDTILRFQERTFMRDAEKVRLAEGLDELKKALRSLGEKV